TLRDRVRNAFASAFCGALVTGALERQRHFLDQNYLGPRKMVHIPFGIDPERFHPDEQSRTALRRVNIPPEKFLVGAPGHFGKETDVDAAIRAFRALCSLVDSTRVTLAVVGTGDAQQVAAINDALASGTPVVAIGVGGVPELVRDGRTGLLVSTQSRVA